MDAHSTAPISTTRPSRYDVSDGNIMDAKHLFTHCLNSDAVVSNPDLCRAHSITPWSLARPSQVPALIVFPSSTAQVSAIMKICFQQRLPVTAYCGGTSIPGALTATRGGICVNFERMSEILEIHQEDMDVVVQPGLGSEDLNANLESLGLFFPPDPAPGAKIGGMIALNCSELDDARGNLTNLMVGSEGAIGLVTEATLKLTSTPRNIHVVIAAFPDTHSAVKAAVDLITSGLIIDALELLDKQSMGAINRSGLSVRRWKESPTLFLKFSGLPLAVYGQLEIARDAAKKYDCEDFDVSAKSEEIKISWGARKKVGPSLMAMKKDPSDLFLNADAAVPISKLAAMIEETHKIILEAGLTGSTLGHVGDGNYHTAIVYPESQKDKGEEVLRWIQRRALELEGTITGEHGIGLNLREGLAEEVGENAIDMMRKIKLALDPLCILNPDKVICMEQ